MATRISTTRTGGIAPASAPAIRTVEDRSAYLPPKRPSANFIPTAEQIAALVERAQAAVSRGIFWDRGSIINVLL